MRPYPCIYSFDKHLLNPYRVLDTATTKVNSIVTLPWKGSKSNVGGKKCGILIMKGVSLPAQI